MGDITHTHTYAPVQPAFVANFVRQVGIEGVHFFIEKDGARLCSSSDPHRQCVMGRTPPQASSTRYPLPFTLPHTIARPQHTGNAATPCRPRNTPSQPHHCLARTACLASPGRKGRGLKARPFSTSRVSPQVLSLSPSPSPSPSGGTHVVHARDERYVSMQHVHQRRLGRWHGRSKRLGVVEKVRHRSVQKAAVLAPKLVRQRAVHLSTWRG